MIRPARPEDVPAIVALIAELARYEHLEHQLRASADSLAAHLFGDPPACRCLVAADEAERVVGYALFFPTYSTFATRPCTWLEDLYVKEAVVGAGPTLKRWLPRAQGRATPILKRMSHVRVVVATRE